MVYNWINYCYDLVLIHYGFMWVNTVIRYRRDLDKKLMAVIGKE